MVNELLKVSGPKIDAEVDAVNIFFAIVLGELIFIEKFLELMPMHGNAGIFVHSSFPAFVAPKVIVTRIMRLGSVVCAKSVRGNKFKRIGSELRAFEKVMPGGDDELVAHNFNGWENGYVGVWRPNHLESFIVTEIIAVGFEVTEARNAGDPSFALVGAGGPTGTRQSQAQGAKNKTNTCSQGQSLHTHRLSNNLLGPVKSSS